MYWKVILHLSMMVWNLNNVIASLIPSWIIDVSKFINTMGFFQYDTKYLVCIIRQFVYLVLITCKIDIIFSRITYMSHTEFNFSHCHYHNNLWPLLHLGEVNFQYILAACLDRKTLLLLEYVYMTVFANDH